MNDKCGICGTREVVYYSVESPVIFFCLSCGEKYLNIFDNYKIKSINQEETE